MYRPYSTLNPLHVMAFAGQGFFTPELNKCATKDLAAEIAEYGATLGIAQLYL